MGVLPDGGGGGEAHLLLGKDKLLLQGLQLLGLFSELELSQGIGARAARVGLLLLLAPRATQPLLGLRELPLQPLHLCTQHAVAARLQVQPVATHHTHAHTARQRQ